MKDSLCRLRPHSGSCFGVDLSIRVSAEPWATWYAFRVDQKRPLQWNERQRQPLQSEPLLQQLRLPQVQTGQPRNTEAWTLLNPDTAKKQFGRTSQNAGTCSNAGHTRRTSFQYGSTPLEQFSSCATGRNVEDRHLLLSEESATCRKLDTRTTAFETGCRKSPPTAEPRIASSKMDHILCVGVWINYPHVDHQVQNFDGVGPQKDPSVKQIPRDTESDDFSHSSSDTSPPKSCEPRRAHYCSQNPAQCSRSSPRYDPLADP
mmetsp:Transcript_37776/g.84464  ORF Transcript_37776/g.84464 Transcript_37776/m.84464 type:complete len:261 (-) Transcript_37776:138-920(-)